MNKGQIPLQVGQSEFFLPSQVYRINELPSNLLEDLGIKVRGKKGKRVRIVLNSLERPEEVLSKLLFYAKEYVSGS